MNLTVCGVGLTNSDLIKIERKHINITPKCFISSTNMTGYLKTWQEKLRILRELPADHPVSKWYLRKQSVSDCKKQEN